MRNFRIKKIQAPKVIKRLKEKGYFAEVSKCPPRTNWKGGCSNPQCCPQHPEAIIEGNFARMPDNWIAIKTNCSSNLLHRLIAQSYTTE